MAAADTLSGFDELEDLSPLDPELLPPAGEKKLVTYG